MGNDVRDSDRAGIILDGISYTATSNTLDGNGYDGGADVIVVQASAVDLGGTDPVTIPAETIPLNQELIQTVDVVKK